MVGRFFIPSTGFYYLSINAAFLLSRCFSHTMICQRIPNHGAWRKRAGIYGGLKPSHVFPEAC